MEMSTYNPRNETHNNENIGKIKEFCETLMHFVNEIGIEKYYYLLKSKEIQNKIIHLLNNNGGKISEMSIKVFLDEILSCVFLSRKKTLKKMN